MIKLSHSYPCDSNHIKKSRGIYTHKGFTLRIDYEAHVPDEVSTNHVLFLSPLPLKLTQIHRQLNNCCLSSAAPEQQQSEWDISKVQPLTM